MNDLIGQQMISCCDSLQFQSCILTVVFFLPWSMPISCAFVIFHFTLILIFFKTQSFTCPVLPFRAVRGTIMGLLTTIRKQALKDKEIRILMLGLDNAGKTTIVKSITHGDLTQIAPTLGFSIETIQHKAYKLNIWDVGGQTSLRPFWRNYFEKTDFLIWVIDALALDRLQDCKYELHKNLNEDRLLGAGLLIWVNKMDAIDPSQQSRIISDIETALELGSIKQHHWRIMPCSAVTGFNIQEGLDYTVEEVKSRLFLLD